MNNKALSFIKNFSYTMFSNLTSLIISTLVTLVVPKVIGVEDYGFWQLYILYISYVGFFHLGWVDGIYLRYGGENYEDLNKEKFFSQFISLFSFQCALTLIISFCSFLFVKEDRILLFVFFALNIIVVNIRYFFLYILQATNRIKEYSVAILMDRIIFGSLVALQLLLGFKNYRLMIISDVIGKVISILYLLWVCKDIVFQKITNFCFDLKEVLANIKSGSQLLLANLASNLIIGIVRFGIEFSWNITTFSKVSLTLSISNFILIFINGTATIIYPIFRRVNAEKLSSIYIMVRDFLTTISFSLLVFYYPFRIVLSSWLPQYSEGFIYMALLLPMVVYEGKISLLTNTYLKTLRKENVMLKINIITLIISLVLTIITTTILKNLNLAVLTILLVQVFRALISEVYLSKQLYFSLKKNIILEIILTIVFVLSGWYISSWLTTLTYSSAFLIYLIIKKEDLTRSFKEISYLIKK